MDGCKIDPNHSVGGIAGLCLENRYVKIVVLIGKGTDILEFRHKSSDTDVLFKTPWGVKNPASHVHDTPEPSAPFMDFYPGGWQEIFPNGGNACVYKGAEWGFHGEICKVPWTYSILEESPRKVAVKFSVQTVRAPFLVEKTLSLDNSSAALFIDETVTNEGAEPMDFMWGHHPAFGAPFLSEDCRLFAPAKRVETGHPLPARQLLPAHTQFDSFPMIQTVKGDAFDVARMHEPAAGFSHLSYLSELEEGWYCLANQKSRLGFALRWDVQIFRYLWLWQEFGGTTQYPWWGRGYCTGIEPHSSIPGMGLQKAMERGTQLTLAPKNSLTTRLCASLFELEGDPKGVSEQGQVIY